MIVTRSEVRERGELRIRLDGVEDLFSTFSVVHPAQHLVDDVSEVACAVGEHLADGGFPVNDQTVPGKEPLGAESGHLLESIGPFFGIALYLLWIAAVRGLPDDEIPGEQIPLLRQPDETGVVGLSFGGSVAHLETGRFAARARRETSGWAR